MIEKLARKLTDRRSEMERDVFEMPPQNWDAFQRRLGGYIELEALLIQVNEVMSGNEKDE